MSEEEVNIVWAMRSVMPRSWQNDYIIRRKQWEETVEAVAKALHENNSFISVTEFMFQCVA